MVFAERLTEFFASEDFAAAATWTPSTGGKQQCAKVLLDSPDDYVLGNTVMSTEYAITLPSIDFQGLKTGETIAVDGTRYKVREVQLLDDGALKQASLSKI